MRITVPAAFAAFLALTLALPAGAQETATEFNLADAKGKGLIALFGITGLGETTDTPGDDPGGVASITGRDFGAAVSQAAREGGLGRAVSEVVSAEASAGADAGPAGDGPAGDGPGNSGGRGR